MENFYIYGVKSAGIIMAFYFFYLLLLQRETFFNANRWFLLFGIVASVVLPLITFSKIVSVEPEVETVIEPSTSTFQNITNNVETSIAPAIVETSSLEINWFWVIMVVYGIGMVVLTIQFLSELYTIRKIVVGKKTNSNQNLILVATNEKLAPFSFFKFIVFNPKSHTENELQNIVEHEKVHCQQFHSVDVLVSRLFSIVFWFNPIVWLYQKIMIQNLEFIADFGAIKAVSNKKSYQLTLLKVTTHQNCVAISNHFYQSLIKKRIVMLNKNQSKSWNSWKYAIVFPLLVLFMLQFQVKVVAQEKEIVSNNAEFSTIIVSKNASDGQLRANCERVKKAHNIDIKFFKIKRNTKGEIQTISASFDDNKGSKSEYKQTKSTFIDDFMFLYEKKSNGKIQIGFQDLNNAKRNSENKYNITLRNGLTITDSLRISKTKFLYRTPAEISIENESLPIYFINDTIRTKKELIDLSPEDIESFTILKPTSAIEKYGQLGKNGVYEVKTKSNSFALSKIPTPPMPPTPPTPPMPNRTKKFIVIDAGHGGKDFGANSNGVSEKQIVADIANKIKSLSNNSEVDIVVIRSDDNFIDLQERASQINQLQPDLFISLHVNMDPNTSINGIEAYVYNKSLFSDESREKANDLIGKLSNKSLVNLGVKDARFLILRRANCPGFLLELGYLSNETNRNYLTSPAGQNEIANKIFQFLKEK